MTSDLQDIIKKSTFDVQEGIFIHAKVKSMPTSEHHFLVSRDSDEITVVTRQEHLSELSLLERNKDDYALIALNVSIPFYCVGFLAEVTKAIAAEGMNVLVVSTYSKDYILIKYDELKIAEQALLELGFTKE